MGIELFCTTLRPPPGAAARKLLELMKTMPKHRGSKANVSAHTKQHLYGLNGAVR